MIGHTPTPWAVFHDHPNANTAKSLGYIRSVDADLGAYNSWGFSDIACCYGCDEPEQKANVEFIVRAVNAHDELVKIVNNAQAILANYLPPNGPGKSETINALLDLFDGPQSRSALAKAEAA